MRVGGGVGRELAGGMVGGGDTYYGIVSEILLKATAGANSNPTLLSTVIIFVSLLPPAP